MSRKRKDRKEKIRIGNEVREVTIPGDAYWGAETALALENFPISGYRVPKPFIEAILYIKKAAALANADLGVIPESLAGAILEACDEALKGKLDDQFVLDVFNAGAGTSLHMNVNEVIAKRATEMLIGSKRGEALTRNRLTKKQRKYFTVDPHNHVNFGQSTNDVIPTAIRIASVLLGRELMPVLVQLRESLKKKGSELHEVKTAGRTHTKDALPIRLGDRFLAYSDRLDACLGPIQHALISLRFLGIGGTAVGTGANVAPGYRQRMIPFLSGYCFGANSEERFYEDPNLFAAMSGMGRFAALGGALRGLAIELNNIARDLELMSSGPNTGINEIELPPVQPGSSIMPGKVNPTIPENLSMVCSAVVGNAAAIDMAAGMTQWELNPRMPLIGWKLIESLTILRNAVRIFDSKCVRGIRANRDRCRYYYENTSSWFTVLNPIIGYEKVAELTSEVLVQTSGTNETILAALIRIARERGICTKSGEEITEAILERMAFPRF